LLSVGRLTEVKNPLKMIEIFSLIEKEIKNISLVIVGDGELLSQAKEYAVMKKLNNVFFLGHLDYKKNVPDLYSCSDFYVMASKYEGQPLTLLEAMSSGLPCIVSDIPNLDIVADAKCGIIVNFSDPNIAAQNIVKYLKENHSIQRSNSRKYIESNFDWSIIANKYLKEFVSLGSSKTHD
jgi:glycosyltransferase involved in cell wall biosynthesis